MFKRIVMLVIVCVIALAVLFVWTRFKAISVNVPTTMISQDRAIDQVRLLPEVQGFVTVVEAAHKDMRRVSYRVEKTTDGQSYIVTVAESDDAKETAWKRFHVKTDGSEILVENNVTGELEPYSQK